MRILFVHQSFPGQFGHLASFLALRGNEVIALRMSDGLIPKGVKVHKYQAKRGNTPKIDPLLLDTESKIIRAESCYFAAQQLKNTGFHPDVIYAHPGWGESLFIKDVWPRARLIHFFEFFYHSQGADSGFDPEFPPDSMNGPRLITKNLVNLMSLDLCDAGVSPTVWQKSLHPAAYQKKIEVIHDGIDTDIAKPGRGISTFTVPNTNKTLTSQDEIVTFVNRNLEPYRGYHSFMRSLPKIMRNRPNVNILIVGNDGVSYGSQSKSQTWQKIFYQEVQSEIDQTRIHFIEKMKYAELIKLLQISSAHVYLTYPFVLSWSMLDAMSTGCLIIGSNTPPVAEVIKDSFNGLLVDFFSPDEIAQRVIEALQDPQKFETIRLQARQSMIESYDLKKICLPKQIKLIDLIAKT